MKAYVTKYALTKGIQLVDVDPPRNGNLIVVYGRNGRTGEHALPEYLQRRNKGWCESWKEALQIAEDKRRRKVETLRRKLQQLETMTWENPDA